VTSRFRRARMEKAEKLLKYYEAVERKKAK
jgi:hypothetical protein